MPQISGLKWGKFNTSGRKLCPKFPGWNKEISCNMWETVCPNFTSWNIENTIFWAGKSAPHVFRWNENFIFQTGNSVPQVSRLKCRKCQILGRKLYALSYWSEIRKISYFRQEAMHPNFPGWQVENFVFQTGNSTPWVTGLKYGNCHIRHVTLWPKYR